MREWLLLHISLCRSTLHESHAWIILSVQGFDVDMILDKMIGPILCHVLQLETKQSNMTLISLRQIKSFCEFATLHQSQRNKSLVNFSFTEDVFATVVIICMSPCKMIDQNQVFFSRLSDSRINQSSIRRCGHYTYQHWACVFPRRGFEKKHCILCLIVHNTIILE